MSEPSAMNRERVNKLLAVAITVLALGGFAIGWPWHRGKLAGYVTFLIAITLLILLRLGAKTDLFRLASRWKIPAASPLGNAWTIGKGLLCIPVALAWVVLVASAIRVELIGDNAITAGLMFIPSVALVIFGFYLVGKGTFGR